MNWLPPSLWYRSSESLPVPRRFCVFGRATNPSSGPHLLLVPDHDATLPYSAVSTENDGEPWM